MVRIIVLFMFVVFSVVGIAQKADLAKSDAIIAESQRKYLEAAKLYKEAADIYLTQEKIDTFCVFKAGQNFVRAKEFEEGTRLLEKVVPLNYRDKNLYLYLADGYDGLKEYKRAEEAYAKGIELYPEEKATYQKKLAYHFYNIKEYEKAIGAIDNALVFFPDNNKLLYLKGNSLGNLSKYDEAIAVFKTILLTDSDNKKAISKIGVFMFKKTESLYKKEVKQYEKLKTPDRIDYHNYRKNIENISIGYKEALPYLEKARVANANDKLVLNCLMISYNRLKMNAKYNEVKAILGY